MVFDDKESAGLFQKEDVVATNVGQRIKYSSQKPTNLYSTGICLRITCNLCVSERDSAKKAIGYILSI